ncbi:MAG: hypothetical protein IT440_16435, partial [Phycisphaeraceae bacterium]|nr:hypothetical protein [Phycisphaeraceae bacterium]
MLTVLLIVLLLMTLMVPIFINIKMKARDAVCKNQLRQIGVLFTSYQTDYDGYFPNDTASKSLTYYTTLIGDIPEPVNTLTSNNRLYKNWNGHLLPYLDVNLSDGYTRYAMVTKVGCTRFNDSQLGGPPNPPPADVLSKGWIVVDDAFRKGGYQDLRVFICPEIHQNTFDIDAAIKYNNVLIPRIAQLCSGAGFQDQNGSSYGMDGGVPTTYLANDIYFGLDTVYDRTNVNSYRRDQITDISQKAFLVEGGSGTTNGNLSSPYYSHDLSNSSYTGAFRACFDKTRPQVHKLSYVHDNYDA